MKTYIKFTVVIFAMLALIDWFFNGTFGLIPLGIGTVAAMYFIEYCKSISKKNKNSKL